MYSGHVLYELHDWLVDKQGFCFQRLWILLLLLLLLTTALDTCPKISRDSENSGALRIHNLPCSHRGGPITPSARIIYSSRPSLNLCFPLPIFSHTCSKMKHTIRTYKLSIKYSGIWSLCMVETGSPTYAYSQLTLFSCRFERALSYVRNELLSKRASQYTLDPPYPVYSTTHEYVSIYGPGPFK